MPLKNILLVPDLTTNLSLALTDTCFEVNFNISSGTIYNSKQRCVAVIPKLNKTYHPDKATKLYYSSSYIWLLCPSDFFGSVLDDSVSKPQLAQSLLPKSKEVEELKMTHWCLNTVGADPIMEMIVETK
ncbi:hypothetical protein QOT17_019089 [Balamuthia mandrillaris]